MNQLSSRRDFVKQTLLGASLAPHLLRPEKAQPPTPPEEIGQATRTLLEPFDYQGVRLLDGRLRNQYLATRDFYYNLSDDDILKGFRKRAGLPAPGNDLGGWCWKDTSTVFGQWLSGMARMSKATGDAAIREKATRLMREWAKTFAADGLPYRVYIARPDISHSHYEFEKTLCGLVDMYNYGDQKEALPLLEKLTEWGMKTLDRRRMPATPADSDATGCGNEWYTLCENLYRAYQVTGDSKYKIFGDLWRYPAYWGKFAENPDPDVHGLHAYSHVNTLSSAAMTYAVTGEGQYLKVLANAYDYFQRTQCYATGGYGPGERLVIPDGSLGKSLESEINTYETPCGSWAVFKLSRYLLQFTGEAKYGDWIEKMVCNGIGAALPMIGSGMTFYYSDYVLQGGRKTYFSDAWPCCSGTYLQDVTDYHNIIYFKDRDSLYVNLYASSEVTWNKEGEEIKLEQATGFPESEMTTLTVRAKKPVAFNLKFRVPMWSRGATVEVNSEKLDSSYTPGKWGVIQRTWKPGDRVAIRIPIPLTQVAIDQQHPHRVALMYGPVVLVGERDALPAATQADPATWMTRIEGPLEFRGRGQAKGRFYPFYRAEYGTFYRMYFDLKV